MDGETFEGILENRIAMMRDVLAKKGREYGRTDRLHNFKAAARHSNKTPEQALMGMKLKHDISIEDIVSDVSCGSPVSIAMVEEKIGDSINYLILLEALIRERLDA